MRVPPRTDGRSPVPGPDPGTETVRTAGEVTRADDASATGEPGRRPLPSLLAVATAVLVVACTAGGDGDVPGTGSADAAAGEPAATTPAAGSGRSAGSGVAAEDDPLYAPWARVLDAHVDEEGLVDYRGLVDEGIDDLRATMDRFADVDPGALSPAERKAFWINAYNALVLWEVAERYPIDSVQEVGSLFGLVGGFFKQKERVAGEERSPDDIEHGILRRRFDDPEIHWALVCAAFGCPRLLARPYRADGLDELLDDLGREFLRQPRALQIDRGSETLWLSRYFDWYAGDFEAASGSVVDYVLEFAADEDDDWIRDHRGSLSVEHIEYDWTLNDQAVGPRSRRIPEPF